MSRPLREGVPGLYAIADEKSLRPRSLASGFEELARSGVRWIQVRAKELNDRELVCQLARCCELAAEHDVRLWINDRVDLAALFPVFGVHLGQNDLRPAEARRVVGESCRIGLSTHDLDQARLAEGDPDVDLVAIGPIFGTTSKERPDPVIGLAGLQRVRQVVAKPLVAIGGIDAKRVAAVLAAGADSAAVIGAVCAVPSIAAGAREMLEAITSAMARERPGRGRDDGGEPRESAR